MGVGRRERCSRNCVDGDALYCEGERRLEEKAQDNDQIY